MDKAARGVLDLARGALAELDLDVVLELAAKRGRGAGRSGGLKRAPVRD
jgi:hypothetical protein